MNTSGQIRTADPRSKVLDDWPLHYGSKNILVLAFVISWVFGKMIRYKLACEFHRKPMLARFDSNTTSVSSLRILWNWQYLSLCCCHFFNAPATVPRTPAPTYKAPSPMPASTTLFTLRCVKSRGCDLPLHAHCFLRAIVSDWAGIILNLSQHNVDNN